MASEFAVSQVFAHKKPHSGTRGLAMPLHSAAQLRDHDEAYNEGKHDNVWVHRCTDAWHFDLKT